MAFTQELRCQNCQTHHIWLEEKQHKVTHQDGSTWWASSYLCMACTHIGVFLKPYITPAESGSIESDLLPGQPQPPVQLNLF